jgi:hypothetical protein
MKKSTVLLFLFGFTLIASNSSAQSIQIDSLSTYHAQPLTSVTIYGNGFNSAFQQNRVFFEGAEAKTISGNEKMLEFTVPIGATYGRVSVLTGGRQAVSKQFLSTTFYGPLPDQMLLSRVEVQKAFIPRTPQYVCNGDIDNDGRMDIIVTSDAEKQLTVMRNKMPLTYIGGVLDDNSFEPGIKLRMDTLAYAVYVSDINGDGKQDILCTSKMGKRIYLFENKATAGGLDSTSFGQAVGLTLNANQLAEVVTSDLNLDGLPDIVVSANSSPGISKIILIKNNLSSKTITETAFTDTIELATGVASNDGPFGICVVDLTGDGKDDIVVTQGFNKTIALFKNTSQPNGAISFSQPVFIVTPKSPYYVTSGDLNDDGKNDLAVTMQDSFVLILLNKQQLNIMDTTGFERLFIKPSQVNDQFTQYYQIKIADLNGDGKNDIITTNWTSALLINWNTATDTRYISEADYSSERMPVVMTNPFGLTIADFNRDGRPDIVATRNIRDFSSPYGRLYFITNTNGSPVGISNQYDMTKNLSPLVYPNPAGEYIQVNPDMKNAPINVRIASMQGRVLLERVVDNFDTKLNLEMLPSEGYYIVTVTYSTGSVFSSKVLLKKE